MAGSLGVGDSQVFVWSRGSQGWEKQTAGGGGGSSGGGQDGRVAAVEGRVMKAGGGAPGLPRLVTSLLTPH